jgi:sporulation protein YlmC with PRC-barrel domain
MIIRILTSVALAAAILLGCTAGGGCDNRVNEIVERSEQAHYPDALKNDLRALRDAALIFLQRGRETECVDIANSMDGLLDDITHRIEARRERAKRRAYLQDAKPVTEIGRIIKAEEVMGTPVRNLKDQELGVIENVALNPNSGQIAYVALATGGFLGLGEKLVAVPWKDLSVTSDGQLYVLNLTPEALEKMEGFDAEEWPGQAINKRQEVNQGINYKGEQREVKGGARQ